MIGHWSYVCKVFDRNTFRTGGIVTPHVLTYGYETCHGQDVVLLRRAATRGGWRGSCDGGACVLRDSFVPRAEGLRRTRGTQRGAILEKAGWILDRRQRDREVERQKI